MISTSHIFVLVMLLTVLAVNSLITCPNYIETGSQNFNTNSYYGVPSNRILATTFSINFATPKNATNYNSALSIEVIDLEFQGTLLSLIVSVSSKSTSQIIVGLRSRSGDYLKTLNVRYLVVLAEYSFINTIVIESVVNIPFSLSNPNPYSVSQAINPINSSASTIGIYLSGFDMTVSNAGSRILDFTPQITATDTSLLLQVFSSNNNGQSIQLDYISYNLLIFDQNRMLTQIGGIFINNYGASTAATSNSYTNSSTAIYNNASFYGIRSFHIRSLATFNYAISSTPTSIQMLSSNTYHYMVMSWAIFVTPCSSPSFFQQNNVCVVCPETTFGNTTSNACQACDSNCLTCSNTSINCTKCLNTSYLAPNSTCVPCGNALTYCSICSNSSACLTCQSYTYLNSSICNLNCSVITLCTVCNLTQSNIVCLTCQSGYIVQNNICNPNCGDGIIIGNEQCDDGNASGDGCSSTCQIQAYYNCSGAPSVCFLGKLQFTPVFFIKSSKRNEVVMRYKIYPTSLPVYLSVNWALGLSITNFSNAVIEGLNFDFASSTIQIKTSYTQSLNDKNVNFALDCLLLGAPSLANISLMSISFLSLTDNNLSIQYYGDGVYVAASVLQYISIAIAVLSLIFFIMGYFGPKLIALECSVVVQISSILLLSLKNLSPFFDSLYWLRLSLGNVNLKGYQYENNLNREFKAQLLSTSSLQNYNIMLITLFLPPLLAVVLKILSVTVWKQKRQLQDSWKHLLGQISLYGVLFCSYSILTIFFMNIRFFEIDIVSSCVGVVTGLIFLAILIALTVVSNNYPKFFKQFKTRFQILNICQYFYNFQAAERIVVAAAIVCLTNESFQVIFIVLIVLVKLGFVVIRKPYVLGGWKRVTANLIITLIILSLYLACKLVNESSSINLIAPCIILALLLVCLLYNGYLIVCELKQKCEENQNSKNTSPRYKDIDHTPQQIVTMRFQKFEKQMLEAFAQKIEQSKVQFNREIIKYEWESYPQLSHNNNFQQIRDKVQKIKNSSNDNIQMIPFRKDSV